MNDILPEEIGRWHQLERAFRETVERCAYQEVRTPVVEPTSLFVRSIGEATDIVEKEMYSFERHHDALTLPRRNSRCCTRVRWYRVDQQHRSRWY
jgi:histidyl-tRNA synthetase